MGKATKTTKAPKKLERIAFIRDFAAICSSGWQLGWHESNGGNLSYRLTNKQAAEVMRSKGAKNAGNADWTACVAEPSLAGALILVTASGSFMKNVAKDPIANCGIIQMNDVADAWRRVWGFKRSRPTSELTAHLMVHAARIEAGFDEDRVVYHAHLPNICALTAVADLEDGPFTRALWLSLTESAIVLPDGVGVLEWMVPGSIELARATREKARDHRAIVWAHHGALCAGKSFDEALGLMHAMEKAAQIRRYIVQMSKGEERDVRSIGAAGLSALDRALGLGLSDTCIQH